jgi:crotonobetainyl-CoA:carnitine CoA-transferase CaiB-like acyl-CoA transferase
MQPGALDGLKVVEMGQLIAGPFAGKTLGEFGADVIKIEAAGRGRPAAQLAADPGRHVRLVAGAVAQQALDRARPAQQGRARRSPRS